MVRRKKSHQPKSSLSHSHTPPLPIAQPLLRHSFEGFICRTKSGTKKYCVISHCLVLVYGNVVLEILMTKKVLCSRKEQKQSATQEQKESQEREQNCHNDDNAIGFIFVSSRERFAVRLEMIKIYENGNPILRAYCLLLDVNKTKHFCFV